MSAHVCNSAHIATCAQIIRKAMKGDDANPLSEIDIRMRLAKENVASVAWRYGAEGQAAFAPLLGAILTELMEKGYSADRIAAPGGQAEEDINEVCFGGRYTVPEYFMDCRTARARPCTDPEAYMHLRFYRYQASEHPEWEKSDTFGLVQMALDSVACDVMKQQLEGRDVWEVEPEGSDEEPASEHDEGLVCA